MTNRTPSARSLLFVAMFSSTFVACYTPENDAYWTVEGTVRGADGAPVDGIKVTCAFDTGSRVETVVVHTGASTTDGGCGSTADGGCTAGAYVCETETFGGGDFAAPAPTEITFEDVDGATNGTFEKKVEQVTVQHAYGVRAPQRLDVELTPAQ